MPSASVQGERFFGNLARKSRLAVEKDGLSQGIFR